MSERLSRKEIKHDIREDSILMSINSFFEYLRGHSRLLIASGLGILVIIGAFFGVRSYLAQRRDKASQMLGRAILVYSAPVVAKDAKPDDPENPSFASDEAHQAKSQELFDAIEKKYGTSGVGAVAEVYLGRLSYEKGDLKQARKFWQDFVDQHPDHMLAATVRLSLLALDRQAGKGAEVVKTLQAQIDAKSGKLPQDVLLFELAQTYEQMKQNSQAKQTYQRLGDEFPDSPLAQKAMAKVRELASAQGTNSVS